MSGLCGRERPGEAAPGYLTLPIHIKYIIEVYWRQP
jgi:hypothetical protein